MRYDLEVNIVGQLTQDGISILADMFYDSSKKIITPAKWDSMSLMPEPVQVAPDLNTSRYNGFRHVKDTAFISGVADPASLSIFKMIIRENIMVPLFNGGDLTFYRYKYKWSINNIVKATEWDERQAVYKCFVDEDIDPLTAQVYTLKLASPGYLGYNREFSYVDYTQVQVKKIQKVDLPAMSERNIIYCCIDSMEIYEVDPSNAKTFKSFNITAIDDSLPGLASLEDRFCIVGLKSDTIYFFDGYRWVNVHADRVFKLSNEDYKFTIFNDPKNDNKKVLLTDCKRISYRDLRIGVAPASMRVLVGLPEFPVKDLTLLGLTDDPTVDTHFLKMTSAVLITNKSDVDMNVDATYEVTPLVNYKQSARSNRDDVVYRNINITPSAIGFKSGLVCVYNTFSPTIPTTYGAYHPLPIQLSMLTDKIEISTLEGVKVSATLSGIDNIPIKGAKIKFNLYQEELAKVGQWMGSGDKTYEAFTGVDGTVDAVLMQLTTKFGYFIQKNWVTDNTIDIPFDIGVTNLNRVYLYIITSDDPFLGKLGANVANGEIPIADYYQSHGKLDTYAIAGRRLAYIKMTPKSTLGGRILQSSFIKPVGMMKFKNKKMTIKELYIQQFKSLGHTILNPDGRKDFVIPTDKNAYQDFSIPDGYVSKYTDIAGWDPEYLIGGIQHFREQEVLVKNGVSIVFPGSLPGTSGSPQDSKIVGYWLATGSGGKVEIDCTFENEVMSLRSERKTIDIVNYVKSEQEFMISDSEITNQNAVLGSFGYYSISEYLKNSFGIGANTYCCVHSDPVTHKCINKSFVDVLDNNTGITRQVPITSFYQLDSLNATTCAHTPEYDKTLPVHQRCPGLDAHFVNPFILHVQK